MVQISKVNPNLKIGLSVWFCMLIINRHIEMHLGAHVCTPDMHIFCIGNWPWVEKKTTL